MADRDHDFGLVMPGSFPEPGIEASNASESAPEGSVLRCGKRKGGETGGNGIHGLRTWSGRTLKVHKQAMADEQAVVYVIGHSFPRLEPEQDTKARVETVRPPRAGRARPARPARA